MRTILLKFTDKEYSKISMAKLRMEQAYGHNYTWNEFIIQLRRECDRK